MTVERDGTRHDLVVAGQRALVARGGPGGRGNKRFAGPTHQTPRFAERGLPGEESWIVMQLKLLADVGLIGLPNAGKSSLLARLTRAHPKVAGYPFTTLEPNLGTLQGESRQLVIADIPGLIEGASEGAGLGHEFLAHVERTRLLVHVLDLSPLDGSDPVTNHAIVERELADHDPRLAALPRMLALSKADLVDPGAGAGRPGRVAAACRTRRPGARHLRGLAHGIAGARRRAAAPRSRAARSRRRLRRRGGRRRGSARRGAGRASRLPARRPRSFQVQKTGKGAFAVTGAGIERLMARYDLENEEALAHVERRLRGIGVIRALEAAGFEAGDDVLIAGTVFELDPDV